MITLNTSINYIITEIFQVFLPDQFCVIWNLNSSEKYDQRIDSCIKLAFSGGYKKKIQMEKKLAN